MNTENEVYSWFVEEESTNGYATYIAFKEATYDDLNTEEKDTFWFKEDAC